MNARLRQDCLEDQGRTMEGGPAPIADLLAVERLALIPLPERPVEVGALREVVVQSTGRVRFETNTYSVPTRYAGQRLTLKADPFRVCIYAGEALVADHARSYGRGQVMEDFRHYVPLLLEKPFAAPFASALRNGTLPPQWEAYRRALVARHADGNREFARVLHLCLTYSVPQVGAALELAAANERYSADAVRQLLVWAGAQPAATEPLDPRAYPAYQQAQARPDLARYNRLRLLPARQEGRPAHPRPSAC